MKDFFSLPKDEKGIASKVVFENVLHSENAPVLTVAIPTYNRPGLLKQSLESILKAIAKVDPSQFEIIIVDNNPEKPSWTEIENDFEVNSFKFKFKYIVNDQNVGMFGNWNKCIELSDGKWLTILNDDDLFREDVFQNFFHYLNEKDEVYIFQYQILNEKDKRTQTLVLNWLKNTRLRRAKKIGLSRYYWGMPSMGSLGVFFKRENAIKAGGFIEQFFPISDWIFISKHMSLVKRGLEINIPCVYYRISTNESINPVTATKSIMDSYDFRIYLGKILEYKNNLFFSRMMFLLRLKGNKRLWGISMENTKLLQEYQIKRFHQLLFPVFRTFIFLKKFF